MRGASKSQKYHFQRRALARLQEGLAKLGIASEYKHGYLTGARFTAWYAFSNASNGETFSQFSLMVNTRPVYLGGDSFWGDPLTIVVRELAKIQDDDPPKEQIEREREKQEGEGG